MTEIIDLTASRRLRLLFDLCDHEENFTQVREVMRKMGVVPPSDEGFAFEHVQSHLREALVANYRPVVEAYGRLIAEIVTCLTLDESEPLDLQALKEEIDTESSMYAEIILAVLGQIALDALENQQVGTAVV
ncbi:hypothetical protein AB0G15_05495 [Streptosporangium sp. NPDC023825]|uniref:hypothetical protein n=1 Tax=Streptosporangium sp. NPDC023825 TaxID=3154909 RepID=UPI003415453A